MYRRFLNNNDYLGIITPEVLAQLTRGNGEHFVRAEEAAEASVVEYLSENYEVEKELAKGKCIADYDRRVSYHHMLRKVRSHQNLQQRLSGRSASIPVSI